MNRAPLHGHSIPPSVADVKEAAGGVAQQSVISSPELRRHHLLFRHRHPRVPSAAPQMQTRTARPMPSLLRCDNPGRALVGVRKRGVAIHFACMFVYVCVCVCVLCRRYRRTCGRIAPHFP